MSSKLGPNGYTGISKQSNTMYTIKYLILVNISPPVLMLFRLIVIYCCQYAKRDS